MDCEPVKGIDTSTPANAIASFTNLYEGGTGGLTGDVWQVNLSGDNPQSWLLDGGSAPSSAEACNVNTTGSGNWDLKLTFVHAAEDGSGGSANKIFIYIHAHMKIQDNITVYLLWVLMEVQTQKTVQTGMLLFHFGIGIKIMVVLLGLHLNNK